MRTLARPRDFRQVLGTGVRVTRGSVTVICKSRQDEGATRLGLIVPRALGGAVVRNRVKRRVRAVARGYRPKPGYDVIVAAAPRASELKFQELERELVAALAAVHLSRGEP